MLYSANTNYVFLCNTVMLVYLLGNKPRVTRSKARFEVSTAMTYRIPVFWVLMHSIRVQSSEISESVTLLLCLKTQKTGHNLRTQSLSTNKCTYYTNTYFSLSGSYRFWLVAVLKELTTEQLATQSNKLDLQYYASECTDCFKNSHHINIKIYKR
jgi:hypothetical protein